VDNLDANYHALRKIAMYTYRIILSIFICYIFYWGARWLSGRSRVRFPMVSLEFFS